MSPAMTPSPCQPLRRLRRRLLPGLAAAPLALVLSCHAASAPEPGVQAGLDRAKQVIANARRIVSPNGIERVQTVRIGGIEQWVSIRGTDRRNPVLLVLHGGPGYVAMPMSWWSAQGWQEYFTVVEWDQRAAGKTWLLSDSAAVMPTLSGERFLADAEEMVAWLRKELGKNRIFVLGHSFGSFVGLQLAQRHPEWLHAYIGVGQTTNSPESERRGWRFAMEAARRDGNAQAVRELESLAPYGTRPGPIPIEHVYKQRKWVAYYGGVMAYRHDSDADSNLSILSPDYTAEELRHLWDGNKAATPPLLPEVLGSDLGKTRKLAFPLILFEGRHDFNVNAEVAADWFAKIEAPEKHLVWFEHSAHMPMTEEPGKFLVSLVRYARPLAEKVGDVAP